eukprot:1024473-Pyramimonas_sp.AAC.1
MPKYKNDPATFSVATSAAPEKRRLTEPPAAWISGRTLFSARSSRRSCNKASAATGIFASRVALSDS